MRTTPRSPAAPSASACSLPMPTIAAPRATPFRTSVPRTKPPSMTNSALPRATLMTSGKSSIAPRP